MRLKETCTRAKDNVHHINVIMFILGYNWQKSRLCQTNYFLNITKTISTSRKGGKRTCINKNLHIHQISDASIMENEYTFQEYHV